MKTPTIDEVRSYAASEGIAQDSASKFFYHYDSAGWIDAQGRSIINWKSKLQGWATTDQFRKGRQQNGSKPGGYATTEEANKKRLSDLYSNAPPGTRFYLHQIEQFVRYGIAEARDFNDEGYKQ